MFTGALTRRSLKMLERNGPVKVSLLDPDLRDLLWKLKMRQKFELWNVNVRQMNWLGVYQAALTNEIFKTNPLWESLKCRLLTNTRKTL